ncbi:MAG: histidine triad nucleotide-binding protein [Anaerolineales bacterium]
MAPDCLFCKIIAGDIPAEIVFRDDQLIAIRDINPVAPVHLLLLPIRHIASVAEAQAADAGLLGALDLAAVRLAAEAGLARGYRLVINTGADGGQSVSHLHLHLMGGRALRWPPG